MSPHTNPPHPRGKYAKPSTIATTALKSQNSPANPRTTEAAISSPVPPALASLNMGLLEWAMSLAACCSRARSLDSSISGAGLLITRIPIAGSHEFPQPVAALAQLVLHRLR